MHYTDIFIDFDDTIYDTHGNAEIALSELYDTLHLSQYFPSLEAFTEPYWAANVELWGQYSRGEVSRDYLILERFRRPLSMGAGLNPDEAYCMKASDIFLDLCACKPGILPGARELLEYLQSRYRLYICSNGFHEVQYRKLKASDTMRYFERVILSEHAKANKPSREFFDYAFRITGADPSRVIMIGDNYQTDILGAHNYGLDTIFFDRWNVGTQGDATHRVERLEDIMRIL